MKNGLEKQAAEDVVALLNNLTADSRNRPAVALSHVRRCHGNVGASAPLSAADAFLPSCLAPFNTFSGLSLTGVATARRTASGIVSSKQSVLGPMESQVDTVQTSVLVVRLGLCILNPNNETSNLATSKSVRQRFS